MFELIEYARMMVGTKAISTLSTGYLNALEYAKTRIQGADMTQMTDKTAPRVTIIHHPDVRRSLMTQKAYAEGSAGAVPVHRGASGSERRADRVRRRRRTWPSGSTTCCCRSSRGSARNGHTKRLTESLQTFGGSGFLQDYPIEQYIRDSKIDSLYEGTTAIQAQDFFFRKIARDQGVALEHVVDQIQKFLDERHARAPNSPRARAVLARPSRICRRWSPR